MNVAGIVIAVPLQRRLSSSLWRGVSKEASRETVEEPSA